MRKVVFIEVFIKTHLEQKIWILSMLCKLLYETVQHLTQRTKLCRLLEQDFSTTNCVLFQMLQT